MLYANATSHTGSSEPPLQGISIPLRPAYPSERDDKLAQAVKHAKPPLFKRTILAPPGLYTSPVGGRASVKDNPAMSFVMLSDSQVQPSPKSPASQTNGDTKSSNQHPPMTSTKHTDGTKESVSPSLETSTRLFEILSSRSDIDHPICAECSELLLSSLQARLAAALKERDAYASFLKELRSNVPTPADVAKAEKELAAAKAEEAKAFEELLALEMEKAILIEEVAELDAEARALDIEEEQFWRDRNAFQQKMASLQEISDAVDAAYEHDARHLEMLQRTNVYNDTFCIGHDGNFGTINGLRLGRLAPPNNTEWVEINSAWGTTALLLKTVAERLGFVFQGYSIKPMGSTSHIDRWDYSQPNSASSSTITTKTSAGGPSAPPRNQQPKVTSLELFSSGDLPLGRTILHRRFNDAMVAFLECLRQLGDFVENGEARTVRGQQAGGLKLPYKVHKDTIGGLNIKLGNTSDEAWTNACKYTLTCCKFLLAHASNVTGAGGGSRRNPS